MFKKCICFAFIIALVPFSLFAENSKDAALPLSDIVITESKIPDPVKNSTEKINIISENDISKKVQSKRNVAELLQYEPGAAVSVLSRNDANWGSFGGFGPTYNVFLLNGLPIDSFVDTMALDPAIIERIEYYRGPGAVLYDSYQSQDFAGNQTPLAGITNLVLKDKIHRPLTRLSAGFGSWWTQNYAAYNQGSKNNLHYFFGTSLERSRYTDYGTDDSWLNMKDNPEYIKNKLYGMLSYFFDTAKINIFAHHTQHKGDVGRPNRKFDHVYDLVNLEYSQNFSDSATLQVKAGFRRYDRRWDEDEGGNTAADFDPVSQDGVLQNIFPLDINLNIRHFGKSLLTVGIDNQFGNYRTFGLSASNNWQKKTQNDAAANSTGIYLQEKFVLDDVLIVRLGGRYNHIRHEYEKISGVQPGIDDASWNVFLWSAGIRFYAVQYLALYANAGSSYRVPGIKSIAGTLSESDFGVPGRNGQLPNPNLDPESGMSFDIGSDFYIQNFAMIGVRGFYTIIDDTIVDNVVNETPSQTRSINAGKMVSYGFEVEGKAKVYSHFNAFANYTLTKNKITNDKFPNLDESNTPFVPAHAANGGIMFEIPSNLLAAVFLHYHGEIYDSADKTNRRKFDDYTILNAKIAKTFTTADGNALTVSFEGENLTNKRFEMPWQFRDPGRAFYGKVELVF